jgi:sulfate permease, SulP family
MMLNIFPFLEWFKAYDLRCLKGDAIAGITVALVLIPQSMAYAQLAGLPAYYGLYASLAPPVVAALFGSSRQLATGPVAVVSLITATSLESIATAGSPGYITYALLLAVMVGLFQFALGVLRLGLVINFLSHPVVNGFTNAAAIIIATSQLPKMLGVYVDKADFHYETIIRVVQAALHYMHWPTLLMGVIAFAIMILLKRYNSRIPGVLAAVVVTTLMSWAFRFEQNTVIRLSTMDSPDGGALVRQFNTSLEAIPPLIAKRAVEDSNLSHAKSAHDTIAMLDAKRNVDVLTIQIDRLKYDASVYRDKIRKLLFMRAVRPDGTFRFIPREKLNDDPATRNEPVWRIKIGHQPLDPEAIVFIGGGEVVGMVPKGLPSLVLPKFELAAMGKMLSFAAIIALLGFMEAISIAKAMAAKTGQRLDPNRELIGQGLGNLAGALSGSYPVSGSFSRSAVNLQAGAVTGMSSVVTSLAVMLTLLFFTPLLYHLPQSVFAAVIMMAVVGLLNIRGFIHAWRAQRHDGVISVLTFISTLAFAPHLDKGILIGVGLSLLVFLYKSMRPHVASLSLSSDHRLHDAMVYGLKECRYIDVVRFDGPLFFANSSYLEDQIAKHRLNKKKLKHIILVCDGINDIDASGLETLSLVMDRVRSAGIDISLSGVNEAVMEVLVRSHLLAKIGPDHIYPNMDKAIRAVHAQTHNEGEESSCPLTTVVYQGSGTQTSVPETRESKVGKATAETPI